MAKSENFCVYNKTEFEVKLNTIVRSAGLPPYNIQDITEGLQAGGMNLMERVYKIKTNQSNKAILVYSSVDVRTNRTREKGADALRVIIWLKTEQGNFFKSYKKHYRIETLFKNLEKSITEINSQHISSFKGFKKNLKYV